MEFEALKILVGSLGGAGIACYAAFILFKSYRSEVDRFHLAQSDRIGALEIAARNCESDRKQIHAEIRSLQTNDITENTIALKELKIACDNFSPKEADAQLTDRK